MARKKEGPDQAHSWIIAMAGFLLNGLVSGISRTTGLFYVALIETYGVSRMEANLPFIMRNMVRSFACPIAGLVGHRYGARGVIFTGGIFTFLGITLCTIAPSFTWICVFWGGMHAFGVALSYTLYPVIVNQYFLKYRATASGISSSGGCFGSFILPAVIEYLLNNIGLSGTFLITGGIIMHVLPASILMAEPSWIRNPKLNTKRKEESTPNNLRSETKNGNFPKNCDDISVVSIKKISSDFFTEERTSTEESFSHKDRDSKVLDQNGLDNLAFVGSHLSLDEKTTAKIELNDDLHCGMRERTVSVGDTNVIVSEPAVSDVSIIGGLLKMFRDSMFYVISISLGGFALLFDPINTVLVDYIQDKGLGENHAKYFISIIAFGGLIGRLCFGWVTDRNFMTVPKFMLLLHVLQGASFLLFPLFNTFELLLVIFTMFGLVSGAMLVLYPVLVSTYLSSVQSLAAGFTSIFTGLISFAILPLIGHFRDTVGSYDGMFIITGALQICVGSLFLFEPCFTKQKTSHRNSSVKISSK